MRAVESMVRPGLPLADIGTDHGYIPADLLLRGIVPFAVLSDINEGPLAICADNLKDPSGNHRERILGIALPDCDFDAFGASRRRVYPENSVPHQP